MDNFVRIFNEVFTLERPNVLKKYFLTEVNVLEVDCREGIEMDVAFRWNFVSCTTKEFNYAENPYVR